MRQTPHLSVGRLDRDRQTDRQRQRGRSNNTCRNTRTWSLVDHSDVQWPTSIRRLGIKTSSVYSHLLVINSVRAIVLQASRQDFSLQWQRIGLPVTT